MPTISSLSKTAGHFIDKYASRKAVNKIFEKGIKYPARFAAGMMVTSIVSKDAVGCVIYTYQSYNNKDIPKERRPFVAALDFTNGIINVVGQIASFYLVDRFLFPRLESRLFTGVLKDVKNDKEHYQRSNSPLSKDSIHNVVANVIKDKAEELKAKGTTTEEAMQNLTELSEKAIKKYGHGSQKVKDLAEGLSIIVTAIATTALIKRTLTPLIATPLADHCKDAFDKGQKNQGPKDPRLEQVIAQQPYMNNKTEDSEKKPFKSMA